MQKNEGRNRHRPGRAAGFTLLELMAVLIIIGMIVGLAVVYVPKAIDNARVQTAKAQLSAFESALGLFNMDNGRYPTDEEGLLALLQCPAGLETSWKGPYIKKTEVPLDPWKTEYRYMTRSGTDGIDVVVICLGSDRQPGGTGNAADLASGGEDPASWLSGTGG